MSKFMDKEGYRHKESPQMVEDIKALESMLKRYISEGATVAEAVYDLVCTLWASAENVKFEIVQADVKKKKAQRAKRKKNSKK